MNNIICPNKECKSHLQPEAPAPKIKQYQGKLKPIALLQCKTCRTLFSERNGTVYFGLKRSPDDFDQVIQLAVCRVSIRDITRITGISEDTIQRWLKKAADFLGPLHDSLVHDLEISECQVDELWSFVLMKKKTALLQGKEDILDIGDQWVFIAIDAVNKLVVHWKIGKRTLETAKVFIAELKGKLKSAPLFTTDEWRGYEEAFLANFCSLETPEPEPVKKRGRPRTKQNRTPNDDLKLAQVHKHRKQGKVIKITEKIIFGDPAVIQEILDHSSVSNRINTSIVERSNGTLRAKVSRVVRETYSFSKSLEMHAAHLTIYFVYYNLIWLHSRLKKTAAWLSGLLSRPYSFRELFEMRVPNWV